MKRSKVGFAAFVLPALIPFVMVVLVPAIWGLCYSFTNWNGVSGTVSFAGFQNYVTIFTSDKGFLQAFIFTTVFALLAVILINFVGFLLALLVTSKIHFTTLLRGIFFMPNLIGGILLGFTWQFIFVQAFGAIAKATGWTFFENWLADQRTGFLGLLILVVWQLSGYMMIIYIAQLQNIPDSLLEAAEIDGANAWQRLRHIILPMVAPAFTIGTFLALSNCFKLYDQNLALTNGGPAGSTEMLAMNIYDSAFKYNQFGVAQAKAVIFLIVVAGIGLLQLYMNKRKEVEF